MRVTRTTTMTATALAAALLLTACSDDPEPDVIEPAPVEDVEIDPDGEDVDPFGEDPAAIDAPDGDPDPMADPAGAGVTEVDIELAADLLGTPEDQVIEDETTRIVRRGDETYAVTMDLLPGRRNVELDPAADGTYVVTRVEIETLDGAPVILEQE